MKNIISFIIIVISFSMFKCTCDKHEDHTPFLNAFYIVNNKSEQISVRTCKNKNLSVFINMRNKDTLYLNHIESYYNDISLYDLDTIFIKYNDIKDTIPIIDINDNNLWVKDSIDLYLSKYYFVYH